MIDKEFEWNIDGVQANTVLEGAEVTIPIDEWNYRDIFCNDKIIELLKSNNQYLSLVLDLGNKKLTDSIVKEFILSYIPKDGFYYIGFDYKVIFTNVLKKLGISEYHMKDMKLSTSVNNTLEAHTFIDEITKAIKKDQEFKDSVPFEVTEDELDKYNLQERLIEYMTPILRNLIGVEYEIKKLVDTQIDEERVLRKNHKQLSKVEHKSVIWKNLMYYTACVSLYLFQGTDDIKYYRYSKNYYKNISEKSKCEIPKGIVVNGRFYDCVHTAFNAKFRAIQRTKFSEILVRLGIEDKDSITFRETLKKGNGLKGTITGTSTPKKKVDYSKITKALGRKITFYKGLESKVQGTIKGFITDTDYIGFVLDNNYVVFDKFYELNKDGTKANPAYGNRVYIVTLDVLEQCGRDKQKIGEYIAKNHDFKALRFNHTDVDSYQKEVTKALDYHDISTVKYKELKLKYENEKNN